MLARSFALYGKVFQTGLQTTLVYRWNFIIRAAVTFIPLIGSVFLWSAVFDEAESIAGFTYDSMIAYFIAIILVDAMATPVEDEFQIANDIREGQINHALLKPMNYLAYRTSLFLASRMAYCSAIFLPMAGALWLLRGFFAGTPIPDTLPLALLATLGSALLQFATAFALAMLAFWLLEIASVVFIVFAVESLAGGHVFPLEILPAPLYQTCLFLPFPYQYWFPASVFLGRLSEAELARGFAMQGIWLVLLFALGQGLWQLGLRRYAAVGG